MKRLPVILIGLISVLISFGALTLRGLHTPGITALATLLPIIPPLLLAMLWAASIDLLAFVGLWGIRNDRKDWKAWAAFLIGASMTLSFQVWELPPEMARAVPPINWILAAVVVETSRRAATVELKDLWPARAHRWIRSWSTGGARRRPSTPSTAQHPALSTPSTEPPRDSWRLRLVRGWSHDTTGQVSPRAAGAGRPAGVRAPGRAPLAVGGDLLDRRQVRDLA